MSTTTNSSVHNDRMFYTLFAVWLFAVIISGGISTPHNTLWSVHVLTSCLVLVCALVRLRGGFPTYVSLLAVALLFAGLCLTLLQLIPLPPSLWNSLPGRELVTLTYENANIPQPALPMTLLPQGTLLAGTAFIFSLAIFCATLTFSRRGMLAAFIAVLLAAVVSSMLAGLQKAQGLDSVWYFYGRPSLPTPSGTFGNRNFFAAQLFTAIPILGAIATTLHEEYKIRKLVLNVFMLLAICLLLAGLALSGSRAGIVLAMIALMMTVFFVYRPFQTAGFAGSIGTTAIATLVGILVVGQASMIGFLRFAAADPLSDYRWTIFGVSKRAIEAFFPFGSGFGSFVPVYQMFEKPNEVIDVYANHAHNEWLELALEGGLPAIVLMVAAVILLFTAIFKLLNSGPRNAYKVFQWAALVVIFLFMAHATVDFGTRTPALLAILVLCSGILSVASDRHRPQDPPPQSRKPQTPDGKTTPQFRSARARFEQPTVAAHPK